MLIAQSACPDVSAVRTRHWPAKLTRSNVMVGIGLTVRSDGLGQVRVAEIAPWGSARWAGKVAVNDVVEYVDGTAARGLTASAAVQLINGGHGAAATVEIVLSRRRASGDVEQHVIELPRASPTTFAAPQVQHDTNSSSLTSTSGAGGDDAGSSRGDPKLVAALHAVSHTYIGGLWRRCMTLAP